MFFIFGWGHQTVKKHGPVKIFHCENCNNDKWWLLYTRRTWFTLFFIPVIPYASEYLMLCPVCNHGVKLDNARFEEFRAIAECNMDLINKKITQEEHAVRLKQLRAAKADNNPITENDPAEKTETQLNYIQQKEEAEKEKAAQAAEQ